MTATAAREATTVPTGVTIHATKSATNAGGGPACLHEDGGNGQDGHEGERQEAYRLRHAEARDERQGHEPQHEGAHATLTAHHGDDDLPADARSERGEPRGWWVPPALNAPQNGRQGASRSAMPASVASANVA